MNTSMVPAVPRSRAATIRTPDREAGAGFCLCADAASSPPSVLHCMPLLFVAGVYVDTRRLLPMDLGSVGGNGVLSSVSAALLKPAVSQLSEDTRVAPKPMSTAFGRRLSSLKSTARPVRVPTERPPQRALAHAFLRTGKGLPCPASCAGLAVFFWRLPGTR